MNSSLNHVYRIIWNAALGLWQVASEATRGRGKTGSSQQARKARRALAAATAMTLASPAAWAVLPTGGNVVAGSATISQAGSALNITQASDKAAINWQSFSIGQGNSVNFVQPSATSVALNRVLGNDVSVIQGAINANGQVFLVNQNGVLFTPTAQVNVGGIVASTQNISTADFMAGKYEFSGNSTATVENQGSITTANGGVVALVAAKVINNGTITAPQGTVGLAAGNTVLLDLGGPVKIQVTEGALNAAIEQSGGIRADGGTIYLTAKAAGNLAASVINHSGVTRALTMASLTGEPQGQTGSIALSADQINHTGMLDVSGLLAGQHGGDIHAQGKHYSDSGTTFADGAAQGGNIDVRATNITQTQGAKVSASSSDGQGGRIEMIGDLGNGRAEFAGQILATGRRRGGFVDTSGAKLLIKDTLRVNTTSSEGETGDWLLDPVDFTIAASGGDITGAALSAALQINNVTIQTLDSSVTCSTNVTCGTGNATGNGDIHVNDSITATGSTRTLTLQASRDINVNKAVKVDGLNLTAVRNVNVNEVVDVGGSLTVNYGASVSGNTFTPNTTVRPTDTGSLNMKMNQDGFVGKINLGGSAGSVSINSNAYTVVRDRAGLQALSSSPSSRLLLANDIDLGGQEWLPVGRTSSDTPFTGSLEGLGHEVKNLSITNAVGNGRVGLLGTTSGLLNITNIGVSGSINATSASMSAGGLIGSITTSSIANVTVLRNVYSKVNVTVSGNAGGLIGNSQVASVINAFSSGNVRNVVNSTNSTGGLIAVFNTGTVRNAFATGNVEGGTTSTGATPPRVGGLIGFVQAASHVNIENVYATGDVIQKSSGLSSTNTPGGLFGAISTVSGNNITVDGAFTTSKIISDISRKGAIVGTGDIQSTGSITVKNVYWDSAKSGLTQTIGGYTTNSGARTIVETNVQNVAIGSPGTQFPNLKPEVWSFVNGTPTLKVFQSAPSIQQVFIRLACGTLCFNTYGDTLPTFVFDDFAAANGTTALTNATLTGTATFNVTDANNNAVSGFSSLSNAGTYKFVYTGGLMASGFELVAGDAVTWTVVPRALTVTTNNFLNSATDAITVANVAGLLQGQEFNGLKFANNVLSTSFGQNTLASNYATTVVVPGATGSDLTVNRALTVNGLNLTLQSDKNINIRNTLTSQGFSDKVTLNYGQGAVAANNTADYNFGLSPEGFVGKLNIHAGQNLSTKLGSDGTSIDYTVITALGEQGSVTGADLQGINGNLAGNFALGGDIDAASTAQWNGGLGFDGIGDGDTGFSGRFTGLGHRVIGLTINRPEETSIGLFQILNGATLRDIGVVDASIAGLGDTGVLAGSGSNVQIRQVYSSGSVNAVSNAGGLIGALRLGGSVKQAFSHSSVMGGSGGVIGGLVGSVGGRSNITLSEVFATGAIKSLSGEVGGLVGRLETKGGAMLLSDAYATGPVTGTTSVGGLIGRLGQSSGTITIANTYAIGLVTATSDAAVVGGLIGTDRVGTVNLNNSFWDTVTTGKTNGIGDRSNSGTGPVGKTTAELKTVATYTSAGWDISGNGGAYPVLTFDGGKIWRSGALITPLFIRLNCGTLCNNTYGDNVTLNFNGFDMTAGSTPVSNASLTGTATYNVLKDNTVIGTTLDSMTDAGTYKIAYTGGLMADGFALSAGDAVTWTVVPRKLTVELVGTEANPLTKVYDGKTSLVLGTQNFQLGNFAPGTTHGATITQTNAAFNSQHVVSANLVSAALNSSHLSVTGDAKASNYELPLVVSKAGNITPKALTITGSTVADKIYNGERAASVTAGTLSGFVNNERLGTTIATGTFANKDVKRDSNGKPIAQDVAVTYTLVDGPSITLNSFQGPVFLGTTTVPGDKSSNYTLIGETLQGTITPKALAVTGLSAESKIYDGKLTATVTGTAVVDTANVVGQDQVSVTGSVSGGLFATKDVGTQKAVSLSGLMLTGAQAGNYMLSAAALTADITAKALTVSGLTAENKTYDGTRTAKVSSVNAVFEGIIQGDMLSVTATGLFDTQDAGSNKAVAFSGIALSGTDAKNYALSTTTASTQANITPKVLTVTNTTVANKTYDGTTAATVTVGTVSGLVAGETLGTTTATGSFADKDVARDANGDVIAKDVTVAYTLVDGTTTTTPPIIVTQPNLCPVGPCTPLTITTTIPGTTINGAKAGNYTLASETKTAKITPKALSISGSKVTDKQYDGTQAATVTAGKLSGLITINGVTETLGATTAVGEFVGKNASSEAQAVNTVYTLVDGANSTHKAGNYSLANEVLTGKITQRVLSITGSTVTGRDYNGTKAATVVVGTLGNLVAGETLGTTTASGTFADKNAGSNKDVTVAYTLADGEGSFTTGAPIPGTGGTQFGPPVIVPGTLASNYTLANETLKGSIAQKAVTVAGIVAEGKTYDGNTTAKLTNQGSVATGIEGETLTVATTGSFNDKNAGARKVNTITTIATNGTTLASNYTLSNATNAVDATIAQKAVSVAGIAAKGKTYDGNTTAELTNQGTVATGIDGETLTVATTGSFNDKNAGDRKVNTLTTIANNGTTLASNYSLINSKGSVNATIAQKAVSVVGIVANGKTYDGNTTAILSNQGTVATGISGESLAVSTTGSFNDKNAGARKVNTTTTIATNGTTLASNYTLSNATNAVDATIAQKAVSVAGIAAKGKTYDGNTTAELTNQGTVATGIDGETLTVATTGSFDKKNAGARKVNTLTTIANNGTTLASNYTLNNTSNSVDATITQKALTIAATATDKVYDGKSTATATLSTSDVVTNDKVTLNQTAANFVNAQGVNDKNVGTSKTVRVTGLSLTGDDALNYTLKNESAAAQTTANITAKSLSITALASDKVYNANTTAEVTLSTSDKIEGDVLTLNKKVANFDTKNVGTGKTVTVEGLSLGGADAGNYVISNANANATDTADISKAALSVSGITAANKTYDGTANATVSTAKAQLKGLFEGDKLSVSATGSFADKKAAPGKTVTLSSSYSGADVDNYTITDQATTTADISKLGGVKVIADKQSKTVGAADPQLTYTVTGLLAGDALAGALAREPGEAAGLYDITQGSLANENYEIAEFTPAQLTISQPIADVAIANAQTLEPKLDLQIEQEAIEERSGDIAPFIIAANQPRASGPAQLIVVNGGIKLPAGQQEEN